MEMAEIEKRTREHNEPMGWLEFNLMAKEQMQGKRFYDMKVMAEVERWEVWPSIKNSLKEQMWVLHNAHPRYRHKCINGSAMLQAS